MPKSSLANNHYKTLEIRDDEPETVGVESKQAPDETPADWKTPNRIKVAKGNVSFVTIHARVLFEIAQHGAISQETLARNLDVTMRTVQRSINDMLAEGYLSVDTTHKPYSYRIDTARLLPYFPGLSVSIFARGSVY